MSNAVLCASLWPDYNLRHPLYASGTLGLFCVAPALRRSNQKEEKSQCRAARRHFCQRKNCVSTFCQGARGQHSELLASFSEESQSLMGLVFHSIYQLAFYWSQPYTCGPASVALHTPAVWEPNSPNTTNVITHLQLIK